MLREEFARLMSLFQDASEGKASKLDDVFKETFVFFEHLNLQLKNGSPEEKAEALRMMNEMYTELIRQSKKITETTGVSEEQLEAFSDNPSNYTEEQWRSIQEAKSKLGKMGQSLMSSISNLNLPKAEKGKVFPEPESPKKHEPPKKAKKSKWMKS